MTSTTPVTENVLAAVLDALTDHPGRWFGLEQIQVMVGRWASRRLVYDTLFSLECREQIVSKIGSQGVRRWTVR